MTTTAPEIPLQFSGDLSALVLEQKSAQAAKLAPGGVIDASDDGYEYTVIVSVTGVVDAVNDVPVPGCYANTLKKRMPKQIANHDWGRPQGKYLWMKELLPGDPQLPKTTPKGDPWPKEAGALIGRVRLFRGTREGDEAAVRWREYGPDLQLSIGYQAKRATRDPRAGIRYLHDVELFENSEVLWGSSPISGPLPSALAVKTLAGVALETKGDDPIHREGYDPVDVAALHAAADDEIDWDEVAEAAKSAPDDDELNADPDQDNEQDADGDDSEDTSDGEQPADADTAAPPAGDSGGLTAQDIADAADLGVQIKAAPRQQQNNNEDFNSKHPRGGKGTPQGGKFVKKGSPTPAGDKDADGLPDNWLAMIKAGDPRYAANAKGGGGGGGGKGRGRQAEKAKAQKLAARAAEMARRDKVDSEFERDRTAEDARRAAADKAIADADKATARALREAETKRRQAWQADLRVRRAAEAQLRRAWEADERRDRVTAAHAKATERKHLPSGELDPDEPHAYVPSEAGTECDECDMSAKTLGVHTDPESMLTGFAWAEDQAWAGTIDAALEVKEGGADRNRGGAERLRRWYLHEAGIPWGSPGDWSACVAIASKHMRPDQARGYCQLRHIEATGEPAGPNAHGGKGKAYRPDELEEKLLTWEPDAEVGDLAAWRPVEVKAATLPAEPMPGTLEERREAVRVAVSDALRGETDDDGKPQWNAVQLLATFPDKAIARRCRWDLGGADVEETFAVPYSFTDGGAVTLGEPESVVVRATIEAAGKPEPGEPADLDEHPAVGLVEDAAYAVKTLGARALEHKAGRVLSRVNEQRLREAIQHLLAVCGVAGVEVDLPSKAQVDDVNKTGDRSQEPTFAPDTTSQAARETKTAPADGVVRLSPTDIAEAMSLLVPLELP